MTRITSTPMATNPYVGIGGGSAQSQPANVLKKAHSGDEHVNARDPAENIKGMPPNMGDGMLPHVVTFQGIISTVSRIYRANDEALKHSFENSRFMRNDTAIMECLEQRQRSCSLLDWHLEPEDEQDPTQQWLANELTAIIKQTPRFMQYRENLMHALWYGKYGVQHRYRWKKVKQQWRVVIDRWLPVNGDKIVFRYDDGTREHDPDQIGIRVGAGFTSNAGVNKPWNPDRVQKVEATDYGLAYFLEPWERDLLALHKHMIEDGEYESPENAGRIHGVGIRSRIYWLWFQKQETLAWMMEYLERSAFGIEIWYYPFGNPEAEKKTRKAAEERIGLGRNIVLVPRPMGEEGMAYGVERIEPGMAGLESMKSLVIEYFGHLIKRYILGQVLTTEAESTGLGSNLASIHLDTYLQIVRYDATNLEETLTTDLVDPLKAYNFPALMEIPIRFKIETESPDVEAKLAGARQAYDMGCKLKEADVMDLIGMSPPEGDDVVLQDAASQQAAMGMDPNQQPFGQDQQNSMVGQQGGGKGMFKGFDVPEAKFDADGAPISEDSEREKLKRYDEAEAVETAENRAKDEEQQGNQQGEEVAAGLNAAMDAEALKSMVNLSTDKQGSNGNGNQVTPGTVQAAIHGELIKGMMDAAAQGVQKYAKQMMLWDEEKPQGTEQWILNDQTGEVQKYKGGWDAGKHPRGQPENAGQFAETPGGSDTTATQAPSSSSPAESMVAAKKTDDGWTTPQWFSGGIPPAWTDVRIAANPEAALLVTGYDAKGRKQSVYSTSHAARQAAAKFARISELLGKEAEIRQQISAQTQQSEAAMAAKLILDTGIRPGSSRDTKAEKQAYGATTLMGQHIIEDGDGGVRLQFTGKKGVALDIPVRDPSVGRWLLQRKADVGESGRLFVVSDGQLRKYVATLNGGGFKPKDFRTLRGTKLAADLVARGDMPTDIKGYKKQVREVAKQVAEALGNTPTIALQSYIDPTVFSKWRVIE